MKKREYPLFLIDRSRNSGYPFDFIACFDREFGFVARVVRFKENAPYEAFLRQSENIHNIEMVSCAVPLGAGGVVLVIEDFLYHVEVTNEAVSRVQHLLKKATKKYLHAEAERTPHGEYGIDEQVKLMELTVERAKRDRAALVARSSEAEATYNIALSEAVLDTLKREQAILQQFYGKKR